MSIVCTNFKLRIIVMKIIIYTVSWDTSQNNVKNSNRQDLWAKTETWHAASISSIYINFVGSYTNLTAWRILFSTSEILCGSIDHKIIPKDDFHCLGYVINLLTKLYYEYKISIPFYSITHLKVSRHFTYLWTESDEIQQLVHNQGQLMLISHDLMMHRPALMVLLNYNSNVIAQDPAAGILRLFHQILYTCLLYFCHMTYQINSNASPTTTANS